MGGCSYSSITIVFETYQVPVGERPVLMDKVLVLVQVIREIQEARRQQP